MQQQILCLACCCAHVSTRHGTGPACLPARRHHHVISLCRLHGSDLRPAMLYLAQGLDQPTTATARGWGREFSPSPSLSTCSYVMILLYFLERRSFMIRPAAIAAHSYPRYICTMYCSSHLAALISVHQPLCSAARGEAGSLFPTVLHHSMLCHAIQCRHPSALLCALYTGKIEVTNKSHVLISSLASISNDSGDKAVIMSATRCACCRCHRLLRMFSRLALSTPHLSHSLDSTPRATASCVFFLQQRHLYDRMSLNSLLPRTKLQSPSVAHHHSCRKYRGA
ncbi:uncharacterized protein J3D65DRAFT_613661 [Phyllosticta citribraziliensis]|uniref:Uncharacterized protein n=1 Tax=Phyllosticta citribraziliensis TaxID=989973 RepID=A0ABR1M487_9PEZI